MDTKAFGGPAQAAWREKVAAAPEFLTVIDEAFRLVYINRTQPGLGDLTGTPVFDFISPDYHDLLRDSAERAHAVGVPQHYHSEAVGPNGETSSYSNWVFAMPSGDGTPSRTAIVGIDITHLGRIEQALDASQVMLRALTRDTPDLINILDEDRRILFSNRTLTGRPVETVLGVQLDDLLPPGDVDTMREAVARVFETGEPSSYETYFPTPRGHVSLSTRIGPVIQGDKVHRVTLITTDVTEQHHAERERQQLSEQLFQAQKMESLGQLTGGIAHDFNNLLTVILGSTELIDTCRDSPDDVTELASDIRMAAKRAAQLTQRLLAFARKQTLTPKALSLNRMVVDETPILERALGEQIAVESRLAEGLCPATSTAPSCRTRC